MKVITQEAIEKVNESLRRQIEQQAGISGKYVLESKIVYNDSFGMIMLVPERIYYSRGDCHLTVNPLEMREPVKWTEIDDPTELEKP